ncbi:MAG: RDD family protein [Bdellovibrionales bacterium]|nr:RDD family protein [Bdellovibrionales bacterium]
MSDAYDDFEIKPLTKGLGFHKKAVKLGESVSRSGISHNSMKRPLPSVPPESFFDPEQGNEEIDSLSGRAQQSLDRTALNLSLAKEEKSNRAHPTRLDSGHPTGGNGELSISTPLPRYPSQDIFSRQVEIDPLPPLSTPDFPPLEPERKPGRPVVKGSLPLSPSIKIEEKLQTGSRRSAHDSKGGGLREVAISLPAIILDFIMVVALSLVFLVTLLSVTKVEILSVAFNLQSDGATQLSLSILFIAIMQMYVVVSRSFFGRTLGEWTFDNQLGDDRQQRSGFYPLLVAWRSLLIVFTGLITLPLLSLIFRVDLAARLSGLQLYYRQQ